MPPPADTYAQVFVRFLRIGMLAWGGPVAQLALIRRELVDDEQWISSARFNRLIAVFQVLPGPEAHEMCVHLGFLRKGRLGGFLAGLGFMLPGFVLILTLSWLYFQLDFRNPVVASAFLGVQIAVIALISRAVQRIGHHILTSPVLWLIAALAALATAAGASFVVVLIAAGVMSALAGRESRGWRRPLALASIAVAVAATGALVAYSLLVQPPLLAEPAGPVVAGQPPSVLDVFLSGLRAGLLTFGGAYTAIPFVRADAVGHGWLTERQFLDGLALSGSLPAPFIIFTTFVGFVAAGPIGALAITAAVFLPAFGFSLLLGNRLEAVVDNEAVHAFLDGVAAGVVGLIVVTTLQLADGILRAVPSVLGGTLIFVVALAALVLLRARTAVVWVMAGAALAGWVLFGLVLP